MRRSGSSSPDVEKTMTQNSKHALRATLFAAFVTLCSLAVWSLPVVANPATPKQEDKIIETYLGFAAAQNARDLERVGAFFVDGPQFLWVSDGRSVWGREATLKRMGRFQGADHWKVLPGLDDAEIIMLSPTSGILHMPLILEIGKAASPNSLKFLVSIVFQQVEGDWKIASLLTTNDKTKR